MRKRFRTEKDIMGSVKIPSESYFGIFTTRAAGNFPISGIKIHGEMNDSILKIKIATAMANMQSNVLNKKTGNAIILACKKILKNHKKYDKEFILDTFQAGAGTPWHMNVNEVVANVALEILRKKKGSYNIVNPHDHVNKSQSSNDVIPSALRITSLYLINELEIEVRNLVTNLKKKGKEFKKLLKASRTHLMDAVPITLGQEFNAWGSDIEKRMRMILDTKGYLQHIHIGGTAVGTGFNTPKDFDKKVVNNLNKITKLELKIASNKVAKTQFMGDFLALSGALRCLAVDLSKITDDIRLMSSGPMTGFNEIELPRVEPGSSIMPGKFNPSMAEMMNMVCFQVIGNDSAIVEAARSGEFDLNVMTPIICHNLIESLYILKNGVREFNNRCVKGIKANKNILKSYYEKTPFVGTALNSVVGYERSAKLIQESIIKGKSIKDLVVEKKILSSKEAKSLFRR